MRFSIRKGYKPTPKPLPKEGLTEDLRNSLWNILDITIWRTKGFMWSQYGGAFMNEFGNALWFAYFKKPIDTRPQDTGETLSIIREYFFKAEWYQVFDLLEFVLGFRFGYSIQTQDIAHGINHVLQEELSPYRCINGVFTEVTDPEEVQMLSQALATDEFARVTAHLRRALELLSDRKAPDYRNSIKESISAVESMAQIVADNSKATLAEALKTIERSGKLHGALKEGFLKIYGYTSDEGGIRHAMLEEPRLGVEDAKFFLLTCTSFVNYLKSKLTRAPA